MQKAFCMFLASAILAVSSLPLLPAGMSGRAQAATYCPLCHMDMGNHIGSHMSKVSMLRIHHVLTPAMRHCRIECCGHHDSGGLPHLLAPHTVSLAGFDAVLVMMDVADASIPVLKPRLLPFPVPPPRYI